MKHDPIGVESSVRSPELLDCAVRELAFLQLRRRRLPSPRLSDAHWAILLNLYVAHAQGRQVLTKNLEESAGVPGTTLLRYLDSLEERGMIQRAQDERDGRVTIIKPAARGLERIASILREAVALSASPDRRAAGTAR